MQKQETKIVLTGGHAATTALATATSLRERMGNDIKIYWIGASRPIESRKILSIENDSFAKLGVIVKPIISGRLHKQLNRYSIYSVAKIPVGFLHALALLISIRPSAVVSFGGFSAFPVVFIAYFFRIPIIVHEQTMAVGLANKLSGFFATKVAISRKESEKFFSAKKSVLIGNPLIKQIANIKPKKELVKVPNILVIGGSRGSQIINNTLKNILPEILDNFSVSHITGQLDYSEFEDFKKTLNNQSRYKTFAFVSPEEIFKFYENADIIISRSGANTVAEIISTKRPAILIPIPWTRFDEQTKNAQLAQKVGIAEILSQENLTHESLLLKIHLVHKNWYKMVRTQESEIAILDRIAAYKLVSLVESYLS